MTVIAYKDGVMAADTMLSDYNAQHRAQKIVRLPDGGVAGGCGLWRKAYVALKYLEEGGDPFAKDAPSLSDSQVLIARPDGTLWIAEEEFPAFPILDSTCSIGCGADAAAMAMRLGLSAVEAVAQVTKQDILCGDPVQSMRVVRIAEMPALQTHTQAKPGKARRKKGK